MQNLFFEVEGIDHFFFVGCVCVSVCLSVCCVHWLNLLMLQLYCKYLEDKNCVSNTHYIGIST